MRKSRLFSSDFESVTKVAGNFRGQMFKMLAFGVSGVLACSLAFAQMSGGNYTINSGSPTGGGNFNSFGDFVSALSSAGNAIAGNVTVTVAPNSGPYVEQIVLPSISGTGPGPGNSRIGITFIGNGEKITYNGGATENATITLNGSDYITFQNLHIERGSSGTYRRGVRLYNNANNIRFDSCLIDVGTYSTSNQAGIVASGSNTSYYNYGVHYNDLEVWNCTIKGGYYGFHGRGPTATSGTWINGADFKNNTFTDIYYYPLYIYYGTYNVNIEGNTFTKGGVSYAYGYAVYLNRVNNLTMTKNINTGYPYGLYTYYINQYNTTLVSGRSLIANNMVAPNETAPSGSTSRYGIYCSYTQNTDFVYNSVYLGSGTSFAYGMRVYYCNNPTVVNNVVQSSSTGTNYMLYMYNPSGTIQCDYNTFYDENNNAQFYYGFSVYSGLSALQSGTSTNANSQRIDPFFVSPTDLHTNGANLYQKGIAVTSVTDDIDGNARPVSAPSHGIHEFVPPQNDAGVFVFNNPVAVCPDTNDVEVSVKNFGALNLTSFNIHWEYSGNGSPVSTGTMAVSNANLAPGVDSLIKISTVVMTAGAPGYNFKAWTSLPNGVTDEQHLNDTMTYYTQTAMEGTYTIGGTSPDFATFTAAAAGLSTFGVCGAVVFDVRQGTYPEQVNLSNIVGTSDVNTVTFQADAANTMPVEVEYSSTSYLEGTFNLDGASYITVDGIDITSLSSSYGHTVALNNESSHNTFKNCILSTPVTSTTSNYMANVYCYSSGNNYNTFENNQLINGAQGFYFYGYPDGNMGTQLIGNTMENIYYQGAYMYYHGDFKAIDNTIEAKGYTTSYGLYLYANTGNDVEIRRNNIGGNYYGAYMYMQGTSQVSPQVTNNKISAGDTNMATSRPYYACYFYGGYGLFAHNALVRQSNYTYAYYGLYFNGGLNKSYNNLIMNVGLGNALYVPGSFSLVESDYNAYANYNGGINGLSYAQGLGLDANSIEISSTIYTDLDSLFTCFDSLVGAGTYLADVPNDINMAARNSQGPTIGPEEYISEAAFSLGDDFDICDGDTVYIGQEVAGATYVWTPGSSTMGILEVTAPGTYSVDITTACGDPTDEIVIGDGSSIAAFSATDNFLTGVFTNTSAKATTYMWDFGDNTTSTDENPSHLYATGGTYTVCLTATGECGDNMVCQDITVSDHVGIGELNGDNAVSIYPNPASNNIFVAVEGVTGDALSIEISNVAGQVILTRNLNGFNGSAQVEVDINDLTKGVYLVKVFTSDMTTTKRLVVQK